MQNKTTTVGTLAQTRAKSTRVAATVFLLPTILLVAVYIIYPIFDTFYLSTFKWNGLNVKLMENIGLNNWKFLLTDKLFWGSFAHNLVVMVCSILLQLPIGFLLATFLDALNKKKAEEEAANADPEIDALVAARTEAKKAKNFAEADRIRDELKARGIEIIDTPQGTKWRKV